MPASEASGVETGLADLADTSLAEISARSPGDSVSTEVLDRIAPRDGGQLLVAASFNSAI